MNMEKDKKYSFLVIEDNWGDFALVEEFLHEQIQAPVIVHAKTYNEAKTILGAGAGKFDIILLDLSLPDKKGEPLIEEIMEMCLNIPVIVLTGYADLAFGVKSLSLGISDYILKEELSSISLYKSIIYSTERRKRISALQEQNEKLKEIAWMQSHVIRAPLARIMGLVQYVKDLEKNDDEKEEMLDLIVVSANELDAVIRSISDKTVVLF